MSKIKLPYIKSYRDRLKVWRYYFNKPGQPRTALPGRPGSREFMDAYQACLDLLEVDKKAPAKTKREMVKKSVKGTMSDLIQRYYASTDFRTLKAITQSTYRNEIEKIRKAHGEKDVGLLDRRGVKKLIAEKAEKPGAANKLLRTLKMLMKFAIDEEMREDDPTTGLKPLKVGDGNGFIAWDENHIEQFERFHPIGSKARLALALLLFTAQRRSDIVKMGRQHVRNGFMAVRQQKTGTFVDIPIHPDLKPVLDAVTVDIPAFILSEIGRPFQPTSFGNWFGDRCREAGLEVGYNAHGLRKAACRRLAEAGCTTLEIMAISGHKSIEEVERYTRSANQKVLAQSAMARLGVSN